jgi:uncharacterized protein (TIGR02996 family)
MSPEEPLLEASRLAYADWLEEHGRTEADRARAEFIRLQSESTCAIAVDAIQERLRSMQPVDKLTVHVVVDNTTDMPSSRPKHIASELRVLLDLGMTELAGEALCSAHHGLCLAVSAHRDSQVRTVLFDAGPDPYFDWQSCLASRSGTSVKGRPGKRKACWGAPADGRRLRQAEGRVVGGV